MQNRDALMWMAMVVSFLTGAVPLSAEIELTDARRMDIERVFVATVRKCNALPEKLDLSETLDGMNISLHEGREIGDTRLHASTTDITVTLSWPDLKLKGVGNGKLIDRLQAEIDQATIESRRLKKKEYPQNYYYLLFKLTPEQAVQRAKDYLKYFDIEIPPHYELTQVAAGRFAIGMWTVHWRPVFKGIPFDRHHMTEQPKVSVDFSEEYGLRGLQQSPILPEPKEYNVKMKREEAIEKAIRLLPMIEKSPFYVRARFPGFMLYSVKEASLCVRAPNWLLDPDRAIYIRRKPVEETRVCWFVHLLTRPTFQMRDGLTLLPPQHFIYLDAATGECIAVDFM